MISGILKPEMRGPVSRFCVSKHCLDRRRQKWEEMFYGSSDGLSDFNTIVFQLGVSRWGLKEKSMVRFVTTEIFFLGCF